MSVPEFLGYLHRHDASRELAWVLLDTLRTRQAARAVAASRISAELARVQSA